MTGRDNDRNLSVQEAADRLGYHPEHVYRLLAKETLRGEKVLNRVWVIKKSEVDRVKAMQDEHGRLPRSDRP